MLGHEYYNYKYEYMGMSGKNFGIDGVTEIDAVLQKDPDPSSESSVYNNEGYFARALYQASTTCPAPSAATPPPGSPRSTAGVTSGPWAAPGSYPRRISSTSLG